MKSQKRIQTVGIGFKVITLHISTQTQLRSSYFINIYYYGPLFEAMFQHVLP